MMVIRSFAYHEERTFEPFELIEDFAFNFQVKKFKIDLDTKKYGDFFDGHDLIFTMIPFSGYPNLHINGDFRPQNLKEYKYISSEK